MAGANIPILNTISTIAENIGWAIIGNLNILFAVAIGGSWAKERAGGAFAALLAFMQFGLCNIWIIMIVLLREFTITSFRLVATAQGIVIPANIYGKLKTISQMVFSLVIMILAELNDIGVLGESFPISAVSNGLLWITAALCVISGVIYVKQSIKLIDFSK